jgi:hypothetical protein
MYLCKKFQFLKSSILFLIAVVFNIVCISAQTPKALTPGYSYLSPASGKVQILAKKSSKYAIDHEDYISYNVFTHAHDTFTRTYYFYDSLGRVSHDSILAYHIKTKSFADSLVDDYFYDTANRVIALVHKGVNGKTLYLKGVDSTIYDKHDLDVGHLSYAYSGGAWQMTYGVKNIFTYNSANLPTQTYSIKYDVPTGSWIPVFRTDAIYGKYNKPFANVDYRYSASKWVMEDSLLVSRYYHNNTIAPDSTYIYVSFNSATNKWEQFFKETIFYNSNAQMISTRRLVKNSSGQWVPGIKDTIVYNKDGITLLNADSLACGLNCYKLSSIYRDSLFYDTDGNISRYDINYKFLNDSTFTLGYRYVYHYKKIITSLPGMAEANQLTIYPNPASDILHIRYSCKTHAAPLFVKIYDMQGRLVYENTYSNQTVTDIPVEHLSKGIYSLQLLDGNNEMNRVIVKE